MTEALAQPQEPQAQAPQPQPPDTLHPAIEPTPELARKNLLWAWLLVGLFLVLFGGTVVVGLVYLWLS
jgi:hypothetical protein